MAIPGFVTTDNGLGQTGFKAPVLAGRIADGGASGGPLPNQASGFICVQSTASLSNQVVTTSMGLRASLVYIPVTTGLLTGGTAPPYTGVGAPLIWNDNTATLHIWSTSRSAWMQQVVGTSFAAGNTTFTTS